MRPAQCRSKTCSTSVAGGRGGLTFVGSGFGIPRFVHWSSTSVTMVIRKTLAIRIRGLACACDVPRRFPARRCRYNSEDRSRPRIYTFTRSCLRALGSPTPAARSRFRALPSRCGPPRVKRLCDRRHPCCHSREVASGFESPRSHESRCHRRRFFGAELASTTRVRCAIEAQRAIALRIAQPALRKASALPGYRAEIISDSMVLRSGTDRS